MLEIIAIIFLSKRIVKIVRAKGQTSAKYIITMLLLWLSLEFLAIALAFKVTGNLMSAMPFGLIGAAIGAYLGYKLALNAPNLNTD